MSQLEQLIEMVTALTNRVNDIQSNAKTLHELDEQTNLEPSSLIHVLNGSTSERITIQQILDQVPNSSNSSSPRIAQWFSEGFRVYGSTPPTWFGQDIFPFTLHFKQSKGTDIDTINCTNTTAVWRAPFDCEIDKFYAFLNEPSVEYVMYKTDVNHMNDTKFYHFIGSGIDNNVTSLTQINEGDFVHLFIKRPDGSPGYVEARVFMSFKEVI